MFVTTSKNNPKYESLHARMSRAMATCSHSEKEISCVKYFNVLLDKWEACETKIGVTDLKPHL